MVSFPRVFFAGGGRWMLSLLAIACGSDLNTDGSLADAAADTSYVGQDAASQSDTSFGDGSIDGGLRSCAMRRYEATLVDKPVDVLLVIDNSGSMGAKIAQIEELINGNFADVLGDSKLDYRLIVLGRHGEHGTNIHEWGPLYGENICVRAPLSGTDCDPVPEQPALTEKFKHYSHWIDGSQTLETVISGFSAPDEHDLAPQGYSTWLRSDSLKAIVVFTDDDPGINLRDEDPSNDDRTAEVADGFEQRLLALSPPLFGVPGSRNYVFHSVVGLASGTEGKVFTADEPIVEGVCRGSENHGGSYQRLSKITGGLRASLCSIESYGALLREVATHIVQRASLQCVLDLPIAELGSVVDASSVYVKLKLSEQDSQTIFPVDSAEECGGNSFYIDDGQLRACPELCAVLSASKEAVVEVHARDCGETECVPTGKEQCDDDIDNDCDSFIDRNDSDCLLR